MNTIHSPSIYNSPASASWIPVCLPKFNPSGFVNAYITFLRKDDSVHPQDSLAFAPDDDSKSGPPTDSGSVKSDPQDGLNESGIALVCINGGGELELIRNWCDSVVKVVPPSSCGHIEILISLFFCFQKLTSDGTLTALLTAYQAKDMDYSVSQLGIPGLRHFVYKSRTQVQITLPIFEDPYDQPNARKRFVDLCDIFRKHLMIFLDSLLCIKLFTMRFMQSRDKRQV